MSNQSHSPYAGGSMPPPNPHYLASQHVGPQPPQKPVKQKRKLFPLVAAGIAGLVVGFAAAPGGGDTTSAAPATVTATTTVNAEGKPAPTVTATAPAVTVTATAPAPATSKAAEKPAGTTLNDGIHVVGSEAPLGRYTTSVPEGAILCYFARLKSDDGDTDSIITNGMFNEGAKGSFTLKAGDKFIELSGGCEWTKVG